MTPKLTALTVNRTQDLQIFSLTLSQLSYQSCQETTCLNHQPTLDRCLEVLQNNLYNVTIKLSWYLFLQSRFLVLSARPTKIYCPCHLRNLLSHRALIYSWWAHPYGKMPSNIQSTMDKGQMARPVNHPALHTNQNMIFSCFFVHKWSQWSLPNSISWTRCSCVEPVGDANV